MESQNVATIGLDTVRHFNCAICFEEYPNSSGYLLHSCNTDLYCFNCIKEYITHLICESTIPVPCPGCGKSLDDETIKRHIDEDIEAKWEEYLNDEKFVLCHACDHKCSLLISQPTFRCTPCNETYCVSCRSSDCDGNDGKCTEEQDAKLKEIENEMEGGFVRKCPRCATILWKESGCDATRCPCCKLRFCWECGLYQSKIAEGSHYCSNFARYDSEFSDYSDG